MDSEFAINDSNLVLEVARRIFRPTASIHAEAVRGGVSTHIYRLGRGDETFYLRILPEVGASFAPEAYAHRRLGQQGVKVPEVIYYEDYNDLLQRSVMITTEIKGWPISEITVDDSTQRGLF